MQQDPPRQTPHSGPVYRVAVGDMVCVCGHIFDGPASREDLASHFQGHRLAVRLYSDFPCSEAPLRPGEAPVEGCECKVCAAMQPRDEGPVRPGTPAWAALLEQAGV